MDTHISLAHGNGGRYMRELIEEIFAHHLGKQQLDVQADAANLQLGEGTPMITTDGFIVQPLEFPGGDIGSLAIHGSCNDLAVCGATPCALTLNAFIEEGLETALLERVIISLAAAAKAVGVSVVAGDTKVLPRGEGSGLVLATTAVGLRPEGILLGLEQIRAGDTILVSGPVGDHGISVMLAREQFGLRGDVQSDSAHVLRLTQAALRHSGLRFMRDPTRGGIATVAHEINRATGLGVRLEQSRLPIREAVQSVCDMLGYDPLFLACEGRVVAIVEETSAANLLTEWRSLPEGKDAAQIGHIEDGHSQLLLTTPLGGQRILEELEDDPLPRIC